MSSTWNGPAVMARIRAAVDAGVTGMAVELEDTIISKIGTLSKGEPSSPGGYFNTQSGVGRNSINHTKAVDGTAYVGTSVDYLRYLNDGAIIKPKNGKALAIPLSDEAKLKVKQLGSPRAAIAAFLAADKKRVYWVKVYGGKMLVRSDSRKMRGSSTPLFLITSKTITIAPRPWATLGQADAAQAMRARFIDEYNRSMAKGAA